MELSSRLPAHHPQSAEHHADLHQHTAYDYNRSSGLAHQAITQITLTQNNDSNEMFFSHFNH
jgi:hypothetical protein